jgi:hypothetical protein
MNTLQKIGERHVIVVCEERGRLIAHGKMVALLLPKKAVRPELSEPLLFKRAVRGQTPILFLRSYVSGSSTFRLAENQYTREKRVWVDENELTRDQQDSLCLQLAVKRIGDVMQRPFKLSVDWRQHEWNYEGWLIDWEVP